MNIPKDKLLHAGVSCLIGLLLGVVLPSWLPWTRAALNVVLIGGGKEAYDKRHPDAHDADWRDLLADAVGAIVGEVIIFFLGA